jgi:hypothetical protein
MNEENPIQLKTTLLLAIMTAFIMVVGNLLGGRQGMIIALVIAEFGHSKIRKK